MVFKAYPSVTGPTSLDLTIFAPKTLAGSFVTNSINVFHRTHSDSKSTPTIEMAAL